MADIIRLLSDSVANQIAAGEVVQRPSSVVKELLENALDAGAHRIDLLLQEAGKTSIQVVDDGKGMSETDARRAFERHATSKIREASDLFALTTMGFRGEALPSIAAVSQMTLLTRQAEDELGTSLEIEGGVVKSQTMETCPAGANFLVQNLFYNIPARRRFLKSNQTELSNVMHEFERVALINPQVHFTLSHNGNMLLDLPADTLRHRITSMFGKKLSEQLISVDVETTVCKMSGFVGSPRTAKKTGLRQFFFVNGRYMRHPYFHKAVQEAFSGMLPTGEQIPYFLKFEVDPATIDVNIHPTKTEIKFENESTIWQIIIAAIRESLAKLNAVPTLDFTNDIPDVEIPVYDTTRPTTNVEFPRVTLPTDYNPFKTRGTQSHNSSTAGWERLFSDSTSKPQAESPGITPQADDFEELDLETGIERSTQHYQYRGQYILTMVKSGLMVIDQHRAHVRVLYNMYRAQMQAHSAPTQRLLFPETIHVAQIDKPLFETSLDAMQSLGFDIAACGDEEYNVCGIPTNMEGLSCQTLFDDMLIRLKEGGAIAHEEIQHRLALSLARKTAMPVGQELNAQEMESLVQQLLSADNPNYTPDGSTIISILEHDYIVKMFH